MKQYLRSRVLQFASFVLVQLLLWSCGAVSSKSGGLSDEAYLLVSATKEYVHTSVLVSIDGNEPIETSVSRDGNMAVRKGQRIAIAPGKHHIMVQNKRGTLLFDKQIFVSTRNTKTIVLP